MILLSLLLSISSYGADNSAQYDAALKAVREAAYKQSGFESNFIQVKKAAETRVNKWLADNHLASVAAIGGAVVPVILERKVLIHSGDFTFEGTFDKKQLLWNKQF